MGPGGEADECPVPLGNHALLPGPLIAQIVGEREVLVQRGLRHGFLQGEGVRRARQPIDALRRERAIQGEERGAILRQANGADRGQGLLRHVFSSGRQDRPFST
jgi:hypothetical protein